MSLIVHPMSRNIITIMVITVTSKQNSLHFDSSMLKDNDNVQSSSRAMSCARRRAATAASRLGLNGATCGFITTGGRLSHESFKG